jgi:hypothetical protein
MRAVFLHFQPRFIDYRVAPFQKNSDGAAIYNPAIAVHVDAFLCGPQAVFCSQSRKL